MHVEDFKDSERRELPERPESEITGATGKQNNRSTCLKRGITGAAGKRSNRKAEKPERPESGITEAT